MDKTHLVKICYPPCHYTGETVIIAHAVTKRESAATEIIC